MPVSADLTLLHASFRVKVEGVLAECKKRGVPMRVFEAFRSAKRQNELFTKVPKVTNARAWSSLHQYGFAADFVLNIPGVNPWAKSPHWQTLHQIAAGFDLVPLSFEMAHLQPANVSLSALQAGRFPAGGGVTWAENMLKAIAEHPQGAPSASGVFA